MKTAKYRDIISASDIPVFREALRECIFLYEQEGNPDFIQRRVPRLKKLLKKLNGKALRQTKFGWQV